MNPRQRMQRTKFVAEIMERMAEDLAELRKFNLRKCCPQSSVQDALDTAHELAALAEEEYLGPAKQLRSEQRSVLVSGHDAQ